MPRMSKSNAREILIKDCDTFHKLTHEVVGIITTWKGTLTVLGPETFQQVINNNRDEIWKSLSNRTPTVSSPQQENSLNDDCMMKMLKESPSKLNLQNLRKLVSWITHQSIGRTKNFWGHDEYKPVWWPGEVPFVCISNSNHQTGKNINKEQIIAIIDSYKNYNNFNEKLENAQINILTSTPQKRRRSFSPSDLPAAKRKGSADNSFSTNSNINDSFFGGIFDNPKLKKQTKKKTSQLTEQASSANKPPLILKPSIRRRCLTELSEPTRMLSDDTVHAFSQILKNSYPSINGFQDVILSQKLRFAKVQLDQPSIQLHYDEQKIHWVCSSYDNTNGVYLYDSLNSTKISSDLETQLALLYADKSMQVNVTVPRIQSQKGGTDCGLFAMAVATAIADGQDPVSLTWDQQKMREHFINCIETENITPFPVTITRGKRTGKLPQSHLFVIDCICDCNLPDSAYEKFDSPGTIQCNQCGFWFHKWCYGSFPTSVRFLCKSCTKN